MRIKKDNSKEWENIQTEMERADLLCGIDEVGRGPLAGPVVACAIIMPKGERIGGVRDSKKLTEKKREALAPLILESCLAYGIGREEEGVIDAINIRQATLSAMKKALENLHDKEGKGVSPDLVVVDAEEVETDLPQISLVKADALVYAVSCASIVAKVYRDHQMIAYSRLYPAYGLEKNKGYGSRQHYQAIEKYGILPIHRRTFLHNENYFDYKVEEDKNPGPSGTS